MGIANTPRTTSLASVSALAFVVAGLGALGNETLHQLGSPAVLLDLTLLITYGGVTLGLLGIYSRVAEASRRLSRAGLVAVGITVVSIAVAVLAKSIFGAEPTGGEVLLSLIVSVAFYLCSSLSFLLFGVASVRTRVPSRAIGSLLLLVVPSRLLVILGVTQVASVLFAVSMLGVGYLLWTGHHPTASRRPRPDSATR